MVRRSKPGLRNSKKEMEKYSWLTGGLRRKWRGEGGDQNVGKNGLHIILEIPVVFLESKWIKEEEVEKSGEEGRREN